MSSSEKGQDQVHSTIWREMQEERIYLQERKGRRPSPKWNLYNLNRKAESMDPQALSQLSIPALIAYPEFPVSTTL